jgi:site-specific DNA recombinase
MPQAHPAGPAGDHRGEAASLPQRAARQDELAQFTDHRPNPPGPAAIAHLRRHLAEVLTHGTPGQRKAIIETHVAEIKIDGTRLVPVFMIPTGDSDGPAETSTDPEFRTMVRVVGRQGLEPRTHGLLAAWSLGASCAGRARYPMA